MSVLTKKAKKVTKGTTISGENFAGIKEMIMSDDKKSHVMALSILESSDYASSETYILCVIKEGLENVYGESESTDEFKKEYPKLFKNVTASLTKDGQEVDNIARLSYKNIFTLVKNHHPEEMEFLLSEISGELRYLLKEYGFSFLDYLDFEVTLKK